MKIDLLIMLANLFGGSILICSYVMQSRSLYMSHDDYLTFVLTGILGFMVFSIGLWLLSRQITGNGIVERESC